MEVIKAMLNKEELPINTTYKLQVNKEARKLRHQKLFSRMGLLRSVAHKALISLRKATKYISLPSTNSSSKALGLNGTFKFKKVPLSVQKRLYRQIGVFACSLFTVMSFAPSNVSFGNSYVENPYAAYAGEIVISDADGYLTKLNPQTGDSDRSTMSDSLTHVVESGETLSQIAAKYDVKVETLMWENDMYNAHSLKLGQELIIPPTDGVYHKVKKGDTLSKVAAKYKVEVDLIAKQNDLANDTTLTIGEELFVPGAKGVIPSAPARRTYARTAGVSRGYVSNHSLPSAQPVAGVSMMWPTNGKVTQGYRRGHAALDIAKYPGGPIWSAKAGTVVKASTGTWAGGYGNHVIVDHGGGVKTLYAHLEYLSVKVGDQVAQGSVLGKMGRTGRVYGRTGIHLHFEVWRNGVKQNPWNYIK